MAEEDGGRPLHEYMSAPAGCWKVFNDVLAKEYSDRDYWKVHRMTVDAYAAQHASGKDPRQTQSVVVHLLALYLTIEKKVEEAKVRKTMEFIIARHEDSFPVLDKPELNGILNVSDVVKAKDANEHQRIVNEWARQVLGRVVASSRVHCFFILSCAQNPFEDARQARELSPISRAFHFSGPYAGVFLLAELAPSFRSGRY